MSPQVHMFVQLRIVTWSMKLCENLENASLTKMSSTESFSDFSGTTLLASC